MVTAALIHLPHAVLWLIGVMALYETLQSLVFLVLEYQSIQWGQKHRPVVSSGDLSFAIIIPAWNEARALPRTLDSILAQSIQPDLIIMADDGSTDDTIATLSDLYALEFQGRMGYSHLYPHLRVLRKPHTGKADSMNQAIASADTNVVLILDADTRLLPGSLTSMMQAFYNNPRLTAVGGILLPRCAAKTRRSKIFEFMQRYEYARMQLWRLVWSRFNSSLIVSGACTAFRRDILEAVGGFNTNSSAEDYEVMFRIHQYWRSRDRPCYVRIEPGLKVHTDAPDNLLTFLRQRRRWARGFFETMFQYRSMVGNTRYGILGLCYLVHNTTTMPMQPLFFFASVLTGLILLLFGQYVMLPNIVLWLYFGKIITDVTIRLIGIRLYGHYFQRREVTLLGGSLEGLVGVFPMMILSQISHAWAWISFWHRQSKW